MSKEIRRQFRELLAQYASQSAEGGGTQLELLVKSLWSDANGGVQQFMDDNGTLQTKHVEGSRAGRTTMLEYLIGKPGTVTPEAEAGRSATDKVKDLSKAREQLNRLVEDEKLESSEDIN